MRFGRFVALAIAASLALTGCVVHHHSGHDAPHHAHRVKKKKKKKRKKRRRRPKPAPARAATPTPAPAPAAAPAKRRPVQVGPETGRVKLGQRKVNFRGDHDVIPVTGRKGTFTAITIKATGSPLEMHRIKVTFRNKQVFEPRVVHVFKKGHETRRIDLPGGERVIRKVEFFYNSLPTRRANRGPGKATIHLFGHR